MKMNQILAALVLMAMICSCNKDNGPDGDITPPRLLSEVAVENDAQIKEYLQTHFYNYEEFTNPPAGFDFKIRLDTIAGENAAKTALIAQVEPRTFNVSSTAFLGLTEEKNISHTYYVLKAREGAGGQPTVADSTFVRFEGSLLDGSVFDSTSSFNWLYLPGFLSGFYNGVASFKVGNDIIVNNDGTTSIENTGLGLVIFPSGMGYFNSPPTTNIGAYDPLIFKLDVGLYVEDTDFDNDGIPSIMEDLDGDGNLNNDNTDSSEEQKRFIQQIPNHADSDDDGDGFPTRDEIIINPDGSITFPDTNGNGIPNYLDDKDN